MKKVLLILLCCLSSISLIGCNEVTLTNGIYIFEDSNEFMKPTLTIQEDSKFSLMFSGFSSYIGKGKYEVKDNDLYLNTEDGEFTYVFKIYKDELIFDAYKSSTALWLSDIKDGSKFILQK